MELGETADRSLECLQRQRIVTVLSRIDAHEMLRMRGKGWLSIAQWPEVGVLSRLMWLGDELGAPISLLLAAGKGRKLFELPLARSIAAGSRFVTPSELCELAGDTNVVTRVRVALNDATPDDVLERLRDDADAEVRRAVLLNARGGKRTCAISAISEQGHHAPKPDPIVSANERLLRELPAIDSASPGERAALAEDAACPDELLHRLLQDEDPWVRFCASTHPRVAPAIAHRIVGDLMRARLTGLSTPAIRRVLSHPAIDSEMLEFLRFHRSPEVRRLVAEHHSTPATLLGLQSGDPSAQVRRAVAANPNCAALDLLAMTDDRTVWTSLVTNTALPQGARHDIWRQLMKSDYAWVLRALALALETGAPDVDAPTEIVAQVSDDLELVLTCPRESRAWSYLCASSHDEALRTACLDGDVRYIDSQRVHTACNSRQLAARVLGLGHALASPVALARHYRSMIGVERMVIAANPATPRSILEQLSRDPHPVVARSAQRTLGQSE